MRAWCLVVSVGCLAGVGSACGDETELETSSSALSDEADPDVPAADTEGAAPIDPPGLSSKSTRELSDEIRALKAEAGGYQDLTSADRARFDALVRARARRQSVPAESRDAFDLDGFVGDLALADPSLDDPGPADPGDGGGL
jgi:hypothetical protein